LAAATSVQVEPGQVYNGTDIAVQTALADTEEKRIDEKTVAKRASLQKEVNLRFLRDTRFALMSSCCVIKEKPMTTSPVKSSKLLYLFNITYF
jgi:hypothetical protein